MNGQTAKGQTAKQLPGIERGIKNLVKLLNSVPYITSASSCEGHFGYDSQYDALRDDPAHVVFYVKKGYENEFERLVQLILIHTTELTNEAYVQVGKQYYGVPEQFPIPYNQHYMVVSFQSLLSPTSSRFEHSDEEKSAITKRAVGKLEAAVSEYLKIMDRNTI